MRASLLSIHPDEQQQTQDVAKIMYVTQGIIMGLEFLIISDIFESVSKPLEERTLNDLLKLGLVVVIRTIIDLSLRSE